MDSVFLTNRRKFIKQGSVLAASLVLQNRISNASANLMKERILFDVIIVGGSNAGLAAAMALGRALRNVLIIDSGRPCNHQTPLSHNFLTQDGKPPAEIAALARKQVLQYKTVNFLDALVTDVTYTHEGFEIQTNIANNYYSKKLIFATGIKDIMPPIPGLSDCWGISVLHCPYCHGYEVRNLSTGILGNGDYGYEFASLISNWTNDLTLFTNGRSNLTFEQSSKLTKHHINIVEDEIQQLEHAKGYVNSIIFKNGKIVPVEAIYTRLDFAQHCEVPITMGCELTSEGYLKTDTSQKTNVKGVYACGDNTTRMRTIANAVAMGTTAGMMVNRELTEDAFAQI